MPIDYAAFGSPLQVFESDDECTSSVIRLSVHAEALVTSTVVTPEATGEVTGEVERLLLVLNGEMPRQQVQQSLGLKHEDHFRKAYLVPALAAHVIEMTLPDTPRSSKQRYRLTGQGLQRRREIEARP